MKRPAEIARARGLRGRQSDAETRVWSHLRNRALFGHKFRRQHPIGPYVADFVCLEQRLVVELDGGQHAGRTGHDARRTRDLEARGFRVIRFWNNEVHEHLEVVLERIARELGETLT